MACCLALSRIPGLGRENGALLGKAVLQQDRIGVHRLADGIGVRLGAPVDEHAQQRQADRAAEIARHVEQARGIGGFRAADRAHGDLVQRHEGEDLADTAQQLRGDEVAAAGLRGEMDIDETARREAQQPEADHQLAHCRSRRIRGSTGISANAGRPERARIQPDC